MRSATMDEYQSRLMLLTIAHEYADDRTA